jgi:hypothetical protein
VQRIVAREEQAFLANHHAAVVLPLIEVLCKHRFAHSIG